MIEYPVSTQTHDVINKGKQQLMYDRDRNMAAIPAKHVIFDAIEQHAPYGAVGGSD